MKVAVVYNRQSKSVINLFGTPNKEKYGKKSIQRIVDSLKSGGHQVKTFEGDKDLIANLEDFMPRVVKNERPGMVFNLSYGVQGQARYTHVPGILEMVGIPYVGSGPLAHSLALDKVVAKMMFVQSGLPTPAFAVLEASDFEVPDIPFPMIVKPKNEAMSFGIKIVKTEAELREAAQVILDKFEQPVLVEQYIDGREINVGILGNNPPLALPPAEIVFGEGGPKIYTVEDKRRKSGREVGVECPANLSPETAEKAQDIARRAFHVLGCADCARVDMRMDADDNLYILEINSLPSMGEHGSFVQGAEAIGLTFAGLVNRLVEVASARYFGMPQPPEIKSGSKDPGDEAFTYITQSRDRIERRLGEWTRRKSRTMDPVGIRGAGRELRKSLEDVGLQPVAELTDTPEVMTYETPAGLTGGTLLIGHLDVPLSLDVTVPLFRREPEWLYGEGIGTSRAPLVMFEYAMRTLRRLRKLRRMKLGVLYYADEGQDCAMSEDMIREAARRASRVFVLKPGNPGDRIITERRGLRRYRIHAHGSPRRLGQKGTKPSVLRWFWSRMEECVQLSSRKDRVAVGVADLKTTSYRMLLPHEVEGILSIGYREPEAADSTESRIRSILKESREGVRFDLEAISDRPPMRKRKQNAELVQTIQGLASDLGVPCEEDSSLLPSVAGLIPSDTPVVCGIGPAATESFTTQEAVQRLSLIQRTLLLTRSLIETTELVPATRTKGSQSTTNE